MSYIDWHREMLADRRRVCDFGRAVRRAVRAGDVVADIGTGSGLLALTAASAGAGRVYAIDRGPVLEVARQIAVDNGLAERITFVRGEAGDVELPERVDLIVGEIIGSFGIEESICEVFSACRERLLKPGGRLLPDHLELSVAPGAIGSELLTWSESVRRDLGLDLRSLEALARHTPAGVRAGPEHLLAPGAVVLRLDLTRDTDVAPEGQASFVTCRPGRMCGLVGWFRALHDGHSIHTTWPPDRGSSWSHAFLPVGEPVDLEAGQRVDVTLVFDDPFISWEVGVEGEELRAFHQFRSVPADDLRPDSERMPDDGSSND